jgi:hypothetical protein
MSLGFFPPTIFITLISSLNLSVNRSANSDFSLKGLSLKTNYFFSLIRLSKQG